MPSLNDFFNFEKLLAQLQNLAIEPGFSLCLLRGPKMSGKSTFLRNLASTGKEGFLIQYIDLARDTRRDVLTRILALCGTSHFSHLAERMFSLLDANVTLDKTRVRNANLTFEIGDIDEKVDLLLASCMPSDLERLGQPPVILIDHCTLGDPGAANSVQVVVDCLRRSRSGLVIVAETTNHAAIDSRIFALSTGGVVPSFFGSPTITIDMPSFDISEVQEWARYVGLACPDGSIETIPALSDGIVGIVWMCLANLRLRWPDPPPEDLP